MKPLDDPACRESSAWLAQEEIFQKFEAAWQERPEPSLADFLPDSDSAQRLELLSELVKIDMEYRWHGGQRVLVEDYLDRFPDLGNRGSVPFELVSEEIRVRRECGQEPSWDELVARFPGRGKELEETWGRQDETASQPRRPMVASSPEPVVLGRYELRGAIGRGAFATVYAAWDPELQREVAIKVPREEFLEDPLLRHRVLREAQSAARLRHPSIVSIHEVVADPGATYIVYEFVPGPTLAALLEQTSPSPRQVAEWVASLAAAVDYAHQCGIIHRDIKPANVLMDGKGQPMLADFGLARQFESTTQWTREGDLLGTPAYMSPEQVRGEHDVVDARSDVYSLGALLFEALTGRLPFASGGVGVFQQILHEEPLSPRSLRPSIPADLETICLKALAKEPASRYPTAGAMANDLQRYLEHRPIVARRIGLAGQLVRWCRRQPAQAALSAALAVLVLGAVVGGLWYERARAMRGAEIRAAIKQACTEVNALVGEVPRVRHQPADWRAVLASATQALQRAERGAAEYPAFVGDDVSRQLGELREFIEAEEKDRRMVVRLDEIQYHWSDIEPGGASYATVDRLPDYEQAFRDYGIPPVSMTPAAASRLMGARPTEVRERLLAALYAWHTIRGGHPDDGQQLAWLGELLAALRPDPWQEKVVSATAARDGAALEALAKQANPAAHPPRLLDHLAGSLVRENARDAALELLRRSLLHHGSDFWLNHNLASLLSSADPPQVEEAIRYFTAAAALRPDDAGVLCNLGVHLQRAARADEATHCFQRAIELNPQLALSHTNLANILWEQGDLDGAAAHCRQAIEVAPELPVAHFSLGIALSRKGDLPGAVAAYRKALDLKPDYVEVHINLGSALQRQGDSKNAIVSLRRAIEHNPKFALARNNLGVALAASGENELAAAEFREAVALQPEYAQAWCGLGLTLRDLGQFEDALAALRRGHELGGGKKALQPSQLWIAELEGLVALDQRLPTARKRPSSLSSPELMEFAQLCFWKQQFGQSATFWQLAFAADAGPAGQVSRFDAARAAALAGCGQGCDDPPLDTATQARWRRQAIEWLQSELAARKEQLPTAGTPAKLASMQSLAGWQQHRDLASLRDEAAILRLPADEQAACRALWADLAELLARASTP